MGKLETHTLEATIGQRLRACGSNWQDDMAINIPLIDGKLGARLIAGQEHDCGWINTPNQNNVNDYDIKHVRLKMTALPINDLTIKLSADYQEASFGGLPIGLDDFTPSTLDQASNTRYDTYDAKIEYEAP